jgi:type II secretory pathway component PulK
MMQAGSTSRAGYHSRAKTRRGGAALLVALFTMTIASALVVAIADSHSQRYAAFRNTRQWDQARYVAEAGLHDALARLEKDITWRAGLAAIEFPLGSGNRYQVSVQDGSDGKVIVQAVGMSGSFSRILSTIIKQGG